MQEVRSVQDADVKGLRVLVRAELNVPLQDGVVADDTRLRLLVPTIDLLRQKGAREITLVGYLGRPGGKVVEELRMTPVRKRLAELTDMTSVVMMENVRFDPREEINDPALATELAKNGDVYVNDAFADSHREYASIVGVPKLLPSYAGLGMMNEIAHLSQALTPPPGALAIIGGAKFETKEPLIEKLLKTYGELLLGGMLGNDLIKARGLPVGESLSSGLPVPIGIAGDERIVVATDAVVRDTKANAERTALVVDTQKDESIVDIGPATTQLWAQKISQASFVLWNGPLGIYEQGFSRGTSAVAEALALRSASGQPPRDFRAVIGGGDTLAALAKFAFNKEKVFISTGGGAMLEFLVQGTLPGIEALRN